MELGSFLWKDILRLNVLLRGVAKCEIGNGTIICFSENLWQDGVLAQKYPRLATFAKQDSISVQEAMQAEELDTFFMLPLSVEALDELEPLHYKRKNLNGYQLGLDSAVRSHRWRPGWRRRW